MRPNGWMLCNGCVNADWKNYELDDAAEIIMRRNSIQNEKKFLHNRQDDGKHDVEWNAEASGGEYPNQDGFGWTMEFTWLWKPKETIWATL